jgi:hypothetical protein
VHYIDNNICIGNLENLSKQNFQMHSYLTKLKYMKFKG